MSSSDNDSLLPGTLLRLRTYRPVGKPALILSTADVGCILEDEHGLTTNGGTVYSETIRTTAGAQFCGPVALYANQFLVQPPNGTSSVTIDLSGRDAQDSLTDITPELATPGQRLTLSVESMQLEHLKKMQFTACGGNGGAGFNALLKPNSVPGDGSAGQDGGEITLVLGTPMTTAISIGRDILDSRNSSAVSPVQSILWAHERHQYVKILWELCTELAKNEKIPGLTYWVDSLIPLISSPRNMNPLDEERIIVRKVLSILSAQLESLRTQIYRSTKVRGGVYGAGGLGWQKRGANGASGKRGQINVHFNNTISTSIRKIPLPLAHPDQCYMLLELAKFNYFQDQRQDCQTQLARLRKRLIWVYDVLPEDPIYKAYADAESSMYLLPRTGLSGTQLTSIESLRHIRSEVDNLERQLASQVDYYGHPEGFVPRGSFAFYKENLGKLLLGLQKAESAHLKFFKSAQAQTERVDALKQVKSIATENMSRTKTLISQVEKVIKTQEVLIIGLNGKMKTAQQELAMLMERMANKIEGLTPSLGFRFLDLVEAAACLCYIHTVPMVITQAVGLGYKSWSLRGIKSDKGDLVNQELLLSAFRSIEADASSLIGAYQQSRTESSTLEVDDPKATKLIANKAEMEKLLNSYAKVLKKESLDELATAFQKYIDVTTARNNAIMQYNNAVNLWSQKTETLAELQVQKNIAVSTAATANPDLPAVSVFMERSYNNMLWLTLEMLYLVERALRFWTLDDTPIVAAGLRDDSINPPTTPTITHETLDIISAQLLDTYAHVHENLGVRASDFHGIKVHLNAAELALLKQNREVFVTVPPAFGWTKIAQSTFAGKCCVRLTKSRFYMTGASSPADGRILVAVTHLGRETLVDGNNGAHDFLHEQIYMHFKYVVANGTKFVPGEEETVDADIGEKTNGEYALVGPFTTWRVEVPEGFNDERVDLSGVTDAFFMFDGTFYPLASARKPEYVL